jgi:hypothetical protein
MQVREELPALTTWQQIGLILATPGYNDGAAFLDEGDMADIARLLDEYKAERDAERDALRTDAVKLHKMLDETVSECDAALRNYQNARIVYEVVIDERDVARAEADALRGALAEMGAYINKYVTLTDTERWLLSTIEAALPSDNSSHVAQ